MLASYFLSRTLVPTMVLYLLPKEAEAEARGEGTGSDPAAGATGVARIWTFARHPSSFHHAFNRGFDRLRLAYQGLLDWVLDHRLGTLTALLGFALGSAVLIPHLGQDFFPAVDAGQFRMHVRARPACASRRRNGSSARSRTPYATSCPRRAGHDPRQHGVDAIVHDHGLCR